MSRDVGLQPERTRLAWRRTALSVTVVALLAVRFAAIDVGGAIGWALAAAGLLLWVVALWMIQHRVAAMAASRPATAGRALFLIALTILGYAALGALLLVASAG